MTDPTTLLVFGGMLLVTAGSPGPSIAALIARVLTSGWRAVLPFLAAMWIGEAIWLTLAVWGLAALATTFHTAFLVLKWAGVAYLLWLAWGLWHREPGAEGAMPERGSALGLFGAGLAVTLGNPKIAVFYLALLPTIVDLGAATLGGWLALTATMLVVLVVIDLAWVALAARARILLRTPAAVRAANRCSAGMMAGAATLIATRQ